MKKVVIAFFIGIPLLSVLLLLLPKENFSENENRYLAKYPNLSMETVLDGQYMEEVNVWLTDHFPARDFWVGLKTKSDLLIGKKIINEIYVLNEDCLIEEYQIPEHTQKVGKILKKFHEKIMDNFPDMRMQIMLVPTASEIYNEVLPRFAPVISQKDAMEEILETSNIDCIHVYETLQCHKNKEYLYYRTDHHWTTTAAYYAYEKYCEDNKILPLKQEDFRQTIVTHDFFGTLYSKVKKYQMKGDSILLYEYPEWNISLYYEDTGLETKTLYNLEYLQKKDKYSLFLDNLHSIIEITNHDVKNGKQLVLIKDSYANSIVPFLVNHFEKIYVFDTRSYTKGVSHFLEENSGITDILILYNMNSIDTDTGINGIY